MPSYAVACLVMMWCTYVSINLLNTDPLNSLSLYTAGLFTPHAAASPSHSRHFHLSLYTPSLHSTADAITDDDPLVMHREVMASGKKDLDAIEKISDIPLSVVNELLYQTKPVRQKRTYRKR